VFGGQVHTRWADGEGIKRCWALITGAASQTTEMGPGARRDTLDDFCGYHNWDGIKNSEGKPIAGEQLFCKYILNSCQKDFGCLDEYCTTQKTRHRGLGLIKFIGELFKLQMLTERIMDECIKTLLGNVENPKEEIQSLCKLPKIAGQSLDTNKARAHMVVCFLQMKELTRGGNVNTYNSCCRYVYWLCLGNLFAYTFLLLITTDHSCNSLPNTNHHRCAQRTWL
jgi:hypothetical protein